MNKKHLLAVIKGKYIGFTMLFLLNLAVLNSQENDSTDSSKIKVICKAEIIDDELKINVEFTNNSDSTIYIPISDWYYRSLFGNVGDWYFVNWKRFNKIYYFDSDSSDDYATIDYDYDAKDIYNSKYFLLPKFIEIVSNESKKIYLSRKLNYSFENIKANKIYNLYLEFQYLKEQEFVSIAKQFKKNLNSTIIKSNSQDSILLQINSNLSLKKDKATIYHLSIGEYLKISKSKVKILKKNHEKFLEYLNNTIECSCTFMLKK